MLRVPISLAASRWEDAILVSAMRCWAVARAQGCNAMPSLSDLLAPAEATMLSPALDSLFLLYAEEQGRPLRCGEADRLDDDEIALLGRLAARPPVLWGEAPSTALDCAIVSTRAMLADYVAIARD